MFLAVWYAGAAFPPTKQVLATNLLYSTFVEFYNLSQMNL
jgi:hypothetical protein